MLFYIKKNKKKVHKYYKLTDICDCFFPKYLPRCSRYWHVCSIIGGNFSEHLLNPKSVDFFPNFLTILGPRLFFEDSFSAFAFDIEGESGVVVLCMHFLGSKKYPPPKQIFYY